MVKIGNLKIEKKSKIIPDKIGQRIVNFSLLERAKRIIKQIVGFKKNLPTKLVFSKLVIRKTKMM